MRVRAKFQVQSITKHAYANGGCEVRLTPVCADGVPENERFHKYTPSGELKMFIDNPPAAEAFELGKAFYVDFTPAD